MIFKNRIDAGQELAEKLSEYADIKDVLILALPCGGVPVAFEAAKKLNAPLDVFPVSKFGVSNHEELAMEATASGGGRILNQSVIKPLKIFEAVIDEKEYRDSLPEPDVYNKTVFLIDDGLTAGATVKAAVIAIRLKNPAKIIVAVPVASPENCEEFRGAVDEIICAVTPQPFYGVGKWYEDFTQITDGEVREFLKRAKENLSSKSVNPKISVVADYRIKNFRSVWQIGIS